MKKIYQNCCIKDKEKKPCRKWENKRLLRKVHRSVSGCDHRDRSSRWPAGWGSRSVVIGAYCKGEGGTRKAYGEYLTDKAEYNARVWPMDEVDSD